MELNEYSSKSLLTFGTLKEFIIEGVKYGFELFKPQGQIGPVIVGKNDRRYLLFKSKNNKEITLYISRNLHDRLSNGESVDLPDCLVYNVVYGKETELVLGINASKFEPIDISKYSKEELNELLMAYYKRDDNSDAMKTEHTSE